jgi:hypothetical protein
VLVWFGDKAVEDLTSNIELFYMYHHTGRDGWTGTVGGYIHTVYTSAPAGVLEYLQQAHVLFRSRHPLMSTVFHDPSI